MGAISKVLRKTKADKLFKRVLKGEEGSPYKSVDDLGKFPVARGVNEPPGVEKKKLKEIGAKIRTETEGSFAKGGRAGYKSGTRGCKLAMKGKGRAYGKNS